MDNQPRIRGNQQCPHADTDNNQAEGFHALTPRQRIYPQRGQNATRHRTEHGFTCAAIEQHDNQ